MPVCTLVFFPSRLFRIDNSVVVDNLNRGVTLGTPKRKRHSSKPSGVSTARCSTISRPVSCQSLIDSRHAVTLLT